MEHASLFSDLVKNGYLTTEYKFVRSISGMTNARVFHVFDRGVDLAIKIETPEFSKNTQGAVMFLEEYRDIKFFPKLLFSVLKRNTFAYEFILGKTRDRLISDQEFEFIIDAVINNYKKSGNLDTWGEHYDIKSTFLDYIMSLLNLEKNISEELLPGEYDSILDELTINFVDIKPEPYFIHGDLGIHNIIFDSGIIVGIIDPQPVFGLPVMDSMFLFTSSEHIKSFDLIVFMKLIEKTNNSSYPKEALISLFRAVLYIKIGKAKRFCRAELNNYIDIYKELSL